jgi:alcohol dehydrogenase YqhD (iron-dependent ADH family)
MKPFDFHLPTRIIFGPGRIGEVGKACNGLGKHALVVTGKGMVKKLGYLKTVRNRLEEKDIEADVFEGVEPNPRVTTIDRGGKFARESGCDFIVALGGGSVMDASKGMACAARNPGSVWDYIKSNSNPNPKPFKDALPVVCIPTVAATGSEADSVAVITNWETKEKVAVRNPALFPKVSIVDPLLTVSLPKETTAYGGIDIISHYLDPYLSSRESSELSDGFAEAGIKTVMKYLPAALKEPENIEARCNLSWASTAALSGFAGAGRDGSFPVHSIEHELSAHYDIPHGLGLAILLPRYMEHMYKANMGRYVRFGENVVDVHSGGDEEKAVEGVERLKEWMKRVGLDKGLSDCGIDDSKFEEMAESIIGLKGDESGCVCGFKELDKKGIMEILKNSL